MVYKSINILEYKTMQNMTNTLSVRSSVAVGYFLLQGVFPRGTREESNYFFIPSLIKSHFFPKYLHVVKEPDGLAPTPM